MSHNEEFHLIEFKSAQRSKINLSCDHCEKSFRHKRNLRIHLRIHSSIRPRYSCPICPKTFLSRSLLNDHENVHLNSKPFECIKCFKRFYGKRNLRQHAAVHKKFNFVCDYCQSTFTRKVNLIHHIQKFHLLPVVEHLDAPPGSYIRVQNVEDTLQCKRCVKSFDSLLLLKEHRRTHSDITKCKICAKIFSHHGSLTYHRRVAHSNEKPFQCTSCDMKFPVKSLLDIHITRIHTKKTPFICSNAHCRQSFHTSAALRSHQISHSTDTLFICHHCAKKFRRKNALMVHLKLHTEERRFECTVCGKMFTQKSNKSRHEKKHESHNNCFCKFCGKSFTRRSEYSYAQHALCKNKRITANQIHTLDQAEQMFDAVTQQIFHLNDC